ncbi:MAG: Lrp/AsnC family transcriptional regulator, partial [Anaerolineales bacterium]|nr:Lrp/AsnC family transcriptional regulator [Anaerolineales bacterium]
ANPALVRRYDAWGSRLYLSVTKAGTVYTYPVDDIWFYVNEDHKFTGYLATQIRAIYDITGDMDFVCVCYFKNAEELDRFIKNQLQLPFVERVLTNIVLNVYKDERRSIPPE